MPWCHCVTRGLLALLLGAFVAAGYHSPLYNEVGFLSMRITVLRGAHASEMLAGARRNPAAQAQGQTVARDFHHAKRFLFGIVACRVLFSPAAGAVYFAFSSSIIISMSSTDVENFTKANPADGARLSALRSTGTMVWAGALISSIGSMGWVMKVRDRRGTAAWPARWRVMQFTLAYAASNSWNLFLLLLPPPIHPSLLGAMSLQSRGPSIGLPVAAIVGGMVGFLVADEVPHLFYGLYGFNHAAVNANFAKWKKEQQ